MSLESKGFLERKGSDPWQASVLLSVALPSGLFNHGLYLENR